MSDLVVKQFSEMGAAVAGGTAGIGLACAEALLEAGVPRLAIIGRNPERGEAALARLRAGAPGAELHYLSADCRSVESARGAVEAAEAQLGGIDVLVNSIASDVTPEILMRIPPEEIEETLDKQAVGPILMTRLVIPYMAERRGGVIVNVSSDAAKTATPGETLIGAAAAAIKMFSQSAALEVKRNGIRINAITPSLVAGTEGTERITSGETFSAKLFAKVATMADLGVSDARDQAALVVYLASPQAARLTGQAISLNGGISAA